MLSGKVGYRVRLEIARMEHADACEEGVGLFRLLRDIVLEMLAPVSAPLCMTRIAFLLSLCAGIWLADGLGRDDLGTRMSFCVSIGTLCFGTSSTGLPRPGNIPCAAQVWGIRRRSVALSLLVAVGSFACSMLLYLCALCACFGSLALARQHSRMRSSACLCRWLVFCKKGA